MDEVIGNKNLYDYLGFKENPFSRFSAEEEVDYLPDIYLQANYYQTLLSALAKEHSRFILGERGSGKSALVIKLKSDLKEQNVFSIIIDDFDEIPLSDNKKQLLERVRELQG